MPTKKAFLAAAFALGAGILVFSAINTATYLAEIEGYVEVCAKGPVYVPPTAAFVRCYGVIRRVVAISDSITEEEEDCQCPKCCDGLCYVIIYVDPADSAENQGKMPEPDKRREIRYLWMEC